MLNQFLPTIINNPIIRRETTSRMRLFSSFLFLGILLFIGYILVIVNWQVMQTRYINSSVQSQEIRYAFSYFSFGIILGLSFMVPFLSATVFTTEKERETWDLLTSTPINMPSILLGKLISSVFFVVIVISSMLPFYGIFFLLGTVTFQEVLFFYALAIEITVILSLIGLLCSIRCKRTIQAVTATFIIGFIYFAGLGLFEMLIREVMNFRSIFSPIQIISPLFLTCTHFWGSGPFRNAGWSGIEMYQFHFKLNSILFIILTILNIWSLYSTREPKPRRIFTDKRLNLNSQKVNDWFARYSPKHNIENFENPIFKNDYRLIFQKRWNWVSVMCLLLIGFGVVQFCFQEMSLYRNAKDMYAMCAIGIIFTPLCIIPYAATCFRGEYDRNTMDLLLTTSLSAEKIVLGKILAGIKIFLFRFLAFSSIPVIASMFILSAVPNPQIALISIIILAILSAIFLLTLGTLISLLSKSSVMAYALTGFVTFLFYFGIACLCVILIISFGLSEDESIFFIQAMVFSSPVMFVWSELFDFQLRYLPSTTHIFMTQSVILLLCSYLCFRTTVHTLKVKSIHS